jgi:hypothetical protein
MPGEAGTSMKERLRGLVFPAAVSIAGAAVAILFSKRPTSLRKAMPRVPDVDVGNLAGELQSKVESMRGTSQADRLGSAEDSPPPTSADLQSRRREREKRRTARRQRSKA